MAAGEQRRDDRVQYLFEDMNKPRKHPRGFTLVELLIASSIYVVIMMSVYLAFHSGVFGYRKIEETLKVYQEAAKILDQLNSDLRNSFAFSEDESKFSGSWQSAGFLTLVDTFDAGMVRSVYSFVSYQLSGNTLTRLCRKGKEALNENSLVGPEEMSGEVEELAFSYAIAPQEGAPLEWRDEWSDPKVLPQAVKIRLVIRNKTREEFERTVFLPSG